MGYPDAKVSLGYLYKWVCWSEYEQEGTSHRGEGYFKHGLREVKTEVAPVFNTSASCILDK